MSQGFSAIFLVIINLGLIWLLMAAPIGQRTLTIRRRLNHPPGKIWQAVHPLGTEATWHPHLLASEADGDGRLVRQSFTHPDRTGKPIRRVLAVEGADANAGSGEFVTRVVEDSALDPTFWATWSERRRLETLDGVPSLVIEQTDRYRGLAFFAFRYFALRREIRALDQWLSGGKADMSGWFEHPLTQVLLAIVSTLILWPFFGLTWFGFTLSAQLTIVIVLHELGHMAAYRAFGHRSARMIVLPLLGGIAIGGRPYASLFEVATCALMGAGVSAFLVPIIIAAHSGAVWAVLPDHADGPMLTFLLVLGAFNILNLLPMYRFDGGQVLRQIFRDRTALAIASFVVTGALLWLGWRIGIPQNGLLAGLSVFALMSLFGAVNVKPRDKLPEMNAPERLVTGFGYYAALAIHAYAIIYACDRLFV